MNFYNDIDPTACAWMRALIQAGVIPPGDVSQKSIVELNPNDLKHYTQCHFFAGIAGWSRALELVGWPKDKPVVTGSCPCQPFSLANINAKGTDDERHLWPAWFNILRVLNPDVIYGEQVPSAIEHGWLDEVCSDLELEGYACGAAIFPAHAFGAGHERKRLYWSAHSERQGRQGCVEWGGRVFGVQKPALSFDSNVFTESRRILGGDFMGLLPRDGVSVQMERNAIKCFGNAIVPEVAAQFIALTESARSDLLGRVATELVAAEPEPLCLDE